MPSPLVALAAAHAVLPVPRPATLLGACKGDPGIVCRFVWDVTHSTTAAQVTSVFFAGPAKLIGQIAFVLLIAVILRIAARRIIRKITSTAADRATARADRPLSVVRERRNPRASALGSVLSNAASVTIFGIAAAIILGDLGVNLAPVLASAGVLGIAIGFGAQNLVQDFLAGIFMLLEDQYGVGDVIAVGKISGTVEAVSLRITRVRDINGVVWHIRNGTIERAGNESQGWARAVVDFPVAYQQDIPQVRRLMLATATGMWQEPDWHDVMLEEPEVWGVQSVSADEVVVRLAARTAPLRQWEVARELRERLKSALDAAGGPGWPAAAGGPASAGTTKKGNEGGGAGAAGDGDDAGGSTAGTVDGTAGTGDGSTGAGEGAAPGR
ncbi:MAG: mechanosensitive ion channel family protein [Actinomycetota bacterium]